MKWREFWLLSASKVWKPKPESAKGINCSVWIVAPLYILAWKKSMDRGAGGLQLHGGAKSHESTHSCFQKEGDQSPLGPSLPAPLCSLPSSSQPAPRKVQLRRHFQTSLWLAPPHFLHSLLLHCSRRGVCVCVCVCFTYIYIRSPVTPPKRDSFLQLHHSIW